MIITDATGSMSSAWSANQKQIVGLLDNINALIEENGGDADI
jgi:hypothetical protein